MVFKDMQNGLEHPDIDDIELMRLAVAGYIIKDMYIMQ